MSRSVRLLIVPVFGIALVALAAAQVRSARPQQAAIAQSAAPITTTQVTAEGRVTPYPGAEVSVGTDMAGILAHVFVTEKTVVKKGDVLADLVVDDLRASRSEATARIGESEANVRLYESEVDRSGRLWQQEIGTKKEFERARRDLEASRAQLATAKAEVVRIDALLAKARITAPIDGVVTLRAVQPGESVDRGATIARVADLKQQRVEAEVDEFDVGRVKLGQSVKITADGFDNIAWRGHVEEIPDTVARRQLKPEDPARLSDTRVLLTKVAFDEAVPLKLGQRVQVQIAMSK